MCELLVSYKYIHRFVGLKYADYLFAILDFCTLVWFNVGTQASYILCSNSQIHFSVLGDVIICHRHKFLSTN